MSKIARVEQKGSSVYAYSIGGSIVRIKNGRLVAFSGTTVTIEYCSKIKTYDENGNVVG